MGTSVSFRSPNTPRWQAFCGAIEARESVDRVRSELFNAGESWGEEFSNQAIAHFVRGLVRAFDTLEDELTQAVRPEAPVLSIVRDARSQAVADGAPASIAIAERALARTLLDAMRQDAPLAASTVEQAAKIWRANRGQTVAVLAQRYLAEIVRQFAMHAVSREASTTFQRAESAREVRDLSRTIGDAAAGFATRVRFDESDLRQTPDDAWNSAVQALFSAGRELPRT